MGFFAICNMVAAYLGVYLLDDAPTGNSSRMVQVVAGVLAVVVLVIIIQRRRTRVK
jgi:hypothetical protein